jgi:hypothetical protein
LPGELRWSQAFGKINAAVCDAHNGHFMIDDLARCSRVTGRDRANEAGVIDPVTVVPQR